MVASGSPKPRIEVQILTDAQSTVVQRLERPTVYREGTGSSPVGTANWEDNGGCLPALEAGGRKFESCFSDDSIKSSLLEFD